jgi:hypothetical protein
MGHITVTDATMEEAIQKAEKLKNKLRVIS